MSDENGNCESCPRYNTHKRSNDWVAVVAFGLILLFVLLLVKL